MISRSLSFLLSLSAIITIGDACSQDDNTKILPPSLANINDDNIQFFKDTKYNNVTTTASMLQHNSIRKVDEHGSTFSRRRNHQKRSNLLRKGNQKSINLPTIAGIVKKQPRFNTLEAALTSVQLLDVFRGSDSGPFTLFAPNNAAFDKLGDILDDLLGQNTLAYILQYHIVDGIVLAEDLRDGPIDSFFGGIINVDVKRNGVTLNGDVNIIKTDIRASNGVIHIIDSVLVPLTVVDVAIQSGFTSLVAAIDKAGLRDALNGPGPFTIFAPTNSAFQTLGPLENLSGSDLEPVLLYHVIDGLVTENDLFEGHVETLQGDDIHIDFKNQTGWEAKEYVQIYGGQSSAKVKQTDIFASNGVIHVIDNVLLP